MSLANMETLSKISEPHIFRFVEKDSTNSNFYRFIQFQWEICFYIETV